MRTQSRIVLALVSAAAVAGITISGATVAVAAPSTDGMGYNQACPDGMGYNCGGSGATTDGMGYN